MSHFDFVRGKVVEDAADVPAGKQPEPLVLSEEYAPVWSTFSAPQEAAAAMGMWAEPPAPARPKSHNDDPALERIHGALNDKSLTVGARADMMLDYRNKQLPMVDIGAMEKMQANDPSFPLYGGGEKKGLHNPLFEKLATDPKMQKMMWDLAARTLTEDPAKLDIQKIWDATQADARATAGEKPLDADTAESNMMALQAMATLENVGKFGTKGLPPELAAKMPPGLVTQIVAAEKAFAHSSSKDAAVMSHDIPGGNKGDGSAFSIDNNLHFFSHAYLTASLVKEHGVNPWQAEAMSGFIGAQYELADYSLKEGSGNSGLKDILSNAEGAAFGTSLIASPRTALPGKFDGAPVENRSHTDFPSLSTLPSDAEAVSKEAQSLSKTGLVWSAIQGTLGRKIDQDVKQQRDTGIPPAPSPPGPH